MQIELPITSDDVLDAMTMTMVAADQLPIEIRRCRRLFMAAVRSMRLRRQATDG